MHSRRVAVRAIILKDGKLLCLKLKTYSSKTQTGVQDYWCTPGGGVDPGEPLELALERELIEELGVKPVIGSLLYIQQFGKKDQEHLEFFFHVLNAADYDYVDLKTTSHGVAEIAEFDFVDPATAYILPAFLTQRDLLTDSQSGSPRLFNYL